MNKLNKRLDFFDSFLKNYHLSKDGVNLNICCPFCNNSNNTKMKMVIHLEKCFFHCWVCGKKGSNVPYLISKINKNIKVPDGLFYKRNSTNSFDLFGEEEEVEELDPVSLPEGFQFFLDDFNPSSPDAREVFRYALKRGTSKHKLCMLRMGFSISNGFRRFLILPSYNEQGELNYYVSRNIDVDTSCGYKYKNATIPKKHIIFNEINIDWNIPLTIVEGPLDLLKTNDNATCLLGSSLTEDMMLFRKIVQNKTDIKLALDSDAYSKAIKIAKTLSAYDVKVDILDTRGPNDIGDMSRNHFNKIYSESKSYTEEDSLLSKIRML